jgi:hypothetical protein
MRLPRPWWRWLLAVGAVLALAVWALAPRAVTVDVGPVATGSLTVTVDEEG